MGEVKFQRSGPEISNGKLTENGDTQRFDLKVLKVSFLRKYCLLSVKCCIGSVFKAALKFASFSMKRRKAKEIKGDDIFKTKLHFLKEYQEIYDANET